jgi:parallel beta-helix repeat protein
VALAPGTYDIQTLRVANNAALSCQGEDAGIVVDNLDAAFVGDWTLSTGGAEKYGADYHYHAAGDGSSTAKWTPDIPEAGNYSVYAWWTAHANRATDARYTVQYNGGSETIEVNQEINGGKWNLLGTFPFAPGTKGSVALSADANEYVIADAIMMVRSPRGVIINSDNITIDSGARISADGEGFATNAGPGRAMNAGDCSGGGGYGGIGGDGRDSLGGPTYGSVDQPTALGSGGAGAYSGRGGGAIKLNVINTLTVNGTVSAKGTRGIGNYAGGSGGSIWLTCDTFAGEGSVTADGGKGANTTYPGGGGGGRISLQWTPGESKRTFTGTISAGGGSGRHYGRAGTIYVPDGLWNELWNDTYPVNGSVALAPGTYDITTLNVTNNADLSCQAEDAGIVVDNRHATFVGDWPSSTGSADKYGYDVQYHAAGGGDNTATWTHHVPEAGNYNVYAWWTVHSNRATNAKYTIYYNGGSEDIEVNQEINGGKWNLLGTFPFAAGTSGSVVLSDDANEYVIADAIMIVKSPQGVVINSYNVTIDSGARISADGEGSGTNAGPGIAVNAGDCSGGGGYGGTGGAGRDSGGGPTYGTIYEPTALGSGGAGAYGGRGGGAIKLNVINTLTVNGPVSAKGTRGIGNYAGGSGGSIWLKCSTFSGEGSVTADGGKGGNTRYPGGGGGGRIHISRTSWEYTGTVSVSGGTGRNSGNDGTIYYDNPFLEWTGEENYTSDGLDPEWGDAATRFTYRIKYTHIYGQEPSTGYPKVHILTDGSDIDGSPFPMSEVDGDTTYDDGKLYYYTTTTDLAQGNYTYYFEAEADNCGPAIGAGVLETSGPSVIVNAAFIGDTPYVSIQDALDKAIPGNTIKITTGLTHHEQITIPSGVTLVGNTADPTSTTITTSSAPVISFAPGSSGSALKGLTIRYTGENATRDISGREHYVQIGDGSADITVDKCLVGRDDYVSGWAGGDSRYLATTTYNDGGIRVGEDSSNISITDCQIRYLAGPGITVETGSNKNIVISNNHIYRNILPHDVRRGGHPWAQAPGVGLNGTARAIITFNEIYSNNVGIGANNLTGTDGTEGVIHIEGNIIHHNNGTNVAGIGLNTKSSTYFKSAEIKGNDIYSNGKAGIRVRYAYDLKLKQNHVHDNGRMGIYLDRVYDFQIYNNKVYRNRFNVRLEYMGRSENDKGFFYKNIIDPMRNPRGLYVSRSAHTVFSSNIIRNSGRYGVYFNEQSGPMDFRHNKVCNNGRPGVRVRRALSGNMFKNVIVSNNRAGIHFDSWASGNLKIYNNTIANNGKGGDARDAGIQFDGGLTTSTYSLFHNIFAFNTKSGYRYGRATWPSKDRWDWVDKGKNFFFWNYGSLAGGTYNHERNQFVNAQWGGPGGTGTDDVTMEEAHWNYDQGAWKFSSDDLYSLNPLDDTGVLEVADGESAGAYSHYLGSSATYAEPDPPTTSPGDPYAGPPDDPPAVPGIGEPF